MVGGVRVATAAGPVGVAGATGVAGSHLVLEEFLLL